MSKLEKAYIAGFLDGDGCIMAQLVRRRDYRFGYQIRVSIVFYQKKSHQEIIYWLKNKLNYGYIRERNDQMVEYTIVGLKEVYSVLKTVYPYIRLKRKLTRLVTKIIKSFPKKMTANKLIRLSKLVDETAKFTYSKKRKNLSNKVKEHLDNISFPRRD